MISPPSQAAAKTGFSVISGPVVRLGDDVSSDLLYPARYMSLRLPHEQAVHAFGGFDDDTPTRAKRSRIVLAGWNMGCGSSREQAVTAMKAAGIELVVARSFSRLFFRNSINTGMPVIESEALVGCLNDGDLLDVDLDAGRAVTPQGEIRFTPLPTALRDIVLRGGLMASLSSRVPT